MALAISAGIGPRWGMADKTAGSGIPDTADVLSEFPIQALLANGRTVSVAPAREAEIAAVHSFYESLSDTATYYRFFGMRPALIEAELRQSVVEDPAHHITLLAWLDDRLIGIAEFVTGSDPEEAELAIVVADDHHHEGVATLLLERLVIVARRCGIHRLIARTLRGNEEMKVVLRTLGLTERIELGDGVIVFTLDLDSYEEMQRRAAVRFEQAMRAASQLHHDARGRPAPDSLP